jgi:hypothetical protein
MASWLDLWRHRIAPLREKHGFRVLGAWSDEQTGEFTWVLTTQDDDADFEGLLSAYEAERAEQVQNSEIAAHIEEVIGVRMVDTVVG